MKPRFLIQLLFSLVLFPELASAQQTTTLTLVEDCHVHNGAGNIDSSFPTSNNIMARNITTGDFGRGLLMFDDSQIAEISGETIDAATLKALVTEVGAEGVIELYNIESSWADDTATWNNQPTFSTSPIATYQISSSDLNQIIEIDITSAVQDWADGTTTYGIAMLPSESDTVRMKIDSMDVQGGTPAVIDVEKGTGAVIKTGSAIVPSWQWRWTSSNDFTASEIRITNITESPVNVVVSFYDQDGNILLDGDDNPSAGVFQASQPISNYNDSTAGQTMSFELGSNQTTLVFPLFTGDSISRRGYAVIS